MGGHEETWKETPVGLGANEPLGYDSDILASSNADPPAGARSQLVNLDSFRAAMQRTTGRPPLVPLLLSRWLSLPEVRLPLSRTVGRRSRLRAHLGRLRIARTHRRCKRAALARLARRQSRVSVCVALPVRNGEAYLAAAIESVLAQEGVSVELRVYDNGSADRSPEIARGYLDEGRVVVIQNERDINYYGSLNRALDDTDAAYFVPFAADDVMLPGNLAIKVAALEKHAAGFAHSRRWIIGADGARRTVTGRHEGVSFHMPAPEILMATLPYNVVCCQAVVVRSQALRSIGGFDARCVYCADWLAWMLLALEHSVVTIDLPLIEQRLHGESGTTSAASQGYFARDLPAALLRALEHPACPPQLVERRQELLAQVYDDCCNELARASHFRLADGWAAYAYAGLALMEEPYRTERVDRYFELTGRAGLAVPTLPFDAVAIPTLSGESLAELAATAARLHRSGMLRRLALVVDADALEQARVAVEGAVADVPGLFVDVVVGRSAAELLAPGGVLLASWGDATIAAAETAGIPAFPYHLPSPFDEPPDTARWEIARSIRGSILHPRSPALGNGGRA